MAKLKQPEGEVKKVDVEVTEEKAVAPVEVKAENKVVSAQPDLSQFYALFNEMKATVDSLRAERDEVVKQMEVLKAEKAAVEEKLTAAQEAPVVHEATVSTTDKLLEILTNKKSEREIVLVHNRELIGGLSTSLRLTGLSIDFHTLGEQRLLSWQQFEECVSKYRKWFDKEIILLGPDHGDLVERYGVPCVKREGCVTLNKAELSTIYKKSERDLEDYFNLLSAADKDFLCTYWLGKCYEKNSNFVNRSKIELLNRLSHNHAFDNFLTGMNFDSTRQ